MSPTKLVACETERDGSTKHRGAGALLCGLQRIRVACIFFSISLSLSLANKIDKKDRIHHFLSIRRTKKSCNKAIHSQSLNGKNGGEWLFRIANIIFHYPSYDNSFRSGKKKVETHSKSALNVSALVEMNLKFPLDLTLVV